MTITEDAIDAYAFSPRQAIAAKALAQRHPDVEAQAVLDDARAVLLALNEVEGAPPINEPDAPPEGWESVAALQAAYGDLVAMLHAVEAERDAMRPVVEAARALRAVWFEPTASMAEATDRARRSRHIREALAAAVDTLDGAQPCICNPTHRTNDPICQHRPAPDSEEGS